MQGLETSRGPWSVLVAGSLCIAMSSACAKTASDAANPGGETPLAGSVGAGEGGAVDGVGASGASGSAGRSSSGGTAGETLGGELAPLATDDATLDAARGAALFDLALQIGYAHGYAQCLCLNPTGSAGSLPGCAQAEAGFREIFFEPGPRQCLLEEGAALPGFDKTLRCRARNLRARGQVYASCEAGVATRPADIGLEACPQDEATAEILDGVICLDAFLCNSGVLIRDSHCDQKLDCEGGEDESGCHELQCGDDLVEAFAACDPDVCRFEFDPPLCSDDQRRIVCGDDTEVSIQQLCDGTRDCASGRDEAYCF